jgi:hypothetical protein
VAIGREHIIERPDLVKSPRVTIQQKPGLAIGILKAVRNESVRQGVRDVFAAVHEAFGFDAKWSFVANVGAKNVTGGNSGDTEGLGQENCLSPLAGTRRTDQEHPDHYPSSPS